jgi:hypothetical protein
MSAPAESAVIADANRLHKREVRTLRNLLPQADASALARTGKNRPANLPLEAGRRDAHNEHPRFCYRTYGSSAVVVYQVDPGLRDVQVGDVIVSVNGVTGPRLMEISATDDQPLVMEIARAYPPGMIRITRRKIPSNTIIPESPSCDVIIGALVRACILNATNPQRSESGRLLRQRRILADHLRATLRALRSTRQELADSQSRLAATAEALGEEKTERILEHVARITLSENLKKEQETSARLDSVVRRLSARPRIKRGTTHVEIGGIVFRNRTSTRRSLA